VRRYPNKRELLISALFETFVPLRMEIQTPVDFSRVIAKIRSIRWQLLPPFRISSFHNLQQWHCDSQENAVLS